MARVKARSLYITALSHEKELDEVEPRGSTKSLIEFRNRERVTHRHMSRLTVL